MVNRTSLLFGLLVAAFCVVATQGQTADPSANVVTKQIYTYLKSGVKYIVGQQLGNADKIPAGYTSLVEALRTQTGKYVGLIGLDYSWTWVGMDVNAMHAPAVTHWGRGGLISASNHPANPWTGGTAWDTANNNLNDLLTPGNAAYTKWMAELDKIATYLADLQSKGITVLWRPFHEMNGNWFWWGSTANGGDATPYKNLWIQMFNYFTNTKKLHNLLWVFAPNAKSASDPALSKYYPGAAYVDILGQDVYDPQLNGFTYNELVTLAAGKPIALTEFGPNAAAWDGSYDWTVLLNLLKTKYPKVTYFMAWSDWQGGLVSIVSNRNANTLMNDPAITTVDKIHYIPATTTTTTTTTTPPPPVNENVYLDAMRTGWTAGAWSQTLFTLTDTYAPSSTYNIKLTCNAYGGVSFRRNTPLYSSSYSSLQFLFISYGTPVMVWLLNDAYTAGPGVLVNSYLPQGTPTNQWVQVSIPLADLGVSSIPKIGGFEFYNNANAPAVIFLDTVVLVAKTRAANVNPETPANNNDNNNNNNKDNTDNTDNSNTDSEDLSDAAITGIVLGSVIGALLLVFAVVVVVVVVVLGRRKTTVAVGPQAGATSYRRMEENL